MSGANDDSLLAKEKEDNEIGDIFDSLESPKNKS